MRSCRVMVRLRKKRTALCTIKFQQRTQLNPQLRTWRATNASSVQLVRSVAPSGHSIAYVMAPMAFLMQNGPNVACPNAFSMGPMGIIMLIGPVVT